MPKVDASLPVGREPAALPEQLLAALGERAVRPCPLPARTRPAGRIRARPGRFRRGRRLFRRGPRAQPSCRRLLEPGASPRHTLPLGWPADGFGLRSPALVRAHARRGARSGRVRRAHAHRVQRSRRLQLHARRAGRVPGARETRARSCSRCTSPTATRRPTTWSPRRPPPATGVCSRSAGWTRTGRRSRRRAAASTTGHAGSSSTPAPRASTSTIPASRPCSPWPTSTGSRSSATPAAASRRSAATPSRSARAIPGCG